MRKIKLFISYSHEDIEYLENLTKFLKPTQRANLIITWTDQKLKAGELIDESINKNLLDADIVTILVSHHYLASDYCYYSEMKPSIERYGANKTPIIVPIILSECDWNGTPLGKHVGLPAGGQPLNQWDDTSSAYMSIVRGIQRHFDQIASEISKEGKFDVMRTIHASTAPKRGNNDIEPSPDKICKYNELIYDNAFGEWYDIWYESHWHNRQPYESIRELLVSHNETKRGYTNHLKLLDIATGTGNTYLSFTREGANIWGTDGSKKMIQKAIINCKSVNVSTEKLIQEPITWTDRDAYLKHFKIGSFDAIINTANSYCHLPPLDPYMEHSLRIFFDLLKPGGLLIIDTKKYISKSDISGSAIYRELKYDPEKEDWVIRDEREETVNTDQYGKLNFHTKMHYDIDRSFHQDVQRAIIAVTVFGPNIPSQMFSIPYFPLPAEILMKKMTSVGFIVKKHPGFGKSLKNWKYDIVTGRKPLK